MAAVPRWLDPGSERGSGALLLWRASSRVRSPRGPPRRPCRARRSPSVTSSRSLVHTTSVLATSDATWAPTTSVVLVAPHRRPVRLDLRLSGPTSANARRDRPAVPSWSRSVAMPGYGSRRGHRPLMPAASLHHLRERAVLLLGGCGLLCKSLQPGRVWTVLARPPRSDEAHRARGGFRDPRRRVGSGRAETGLVVAGEGDDR